MVSPSTGEAGVLAISAVWSSSGHIEGRKWSQIAGCPTMGGYQLSTSSIRTLYPQDRGEVAHFRPLILMEGSSY